MHEVIPLVLSYLRGIWRYRWYMLLVFWVVSLMGWAAILALPNVYEARAKIHINSESLLNPLLTGLTVRSSMKEKVLVITRSLLSRANLEKIIHTAQLDLPAMNSHNIDNQAQREMAKEKLLKSLEENIQVNRAGGRSLERNTFTIQYQHKDPQRAFAVVDAMLKSFEQGLVLARQDDNYRARQFLNNQIEQYESRLEAAEQEIKEFKLKYFNELSQSDRGFYARLESAKTELKQAMLSLDEARNKRDEIQRQINGEAPSFDISSMAPTTAAMGIQQRVDTTRAELDNLLLRYTPQHPDVIALKNRINELIRLKKIEVDARSKARAARDPYDLNPVYRQMRIALSEAEREVSSLTVRVNEYSNRVKDLEKKVFTIPEIEAQNAKLNRTYNNTKRTYDVLLKRSESAVMSQQVVDDEDKVQFRTIEGPIVPKLPVSPNRPLLLPAVLFMSLVLGIGLAYFLAQIRPTFDSRRQLAQLAGLPVLGSVSVFLNEKQRKQRKYLLAYYSFGLLALLLVFALAQLSVTTGFQYSETLSQAVSQTWA